MPPAYIIKTLAALVVSSINFYFRLPFMKCRFFLNTEQTQFFFFSPFVFLRWDLTTAQGWAGVPCVTLLVSATMPSEKAPVLQGYLYMKSLKCLQCTAKHWPVKMSLLPYCVWRFLAEIKKSLERHWCLKESRCLHHHREGLWPYPQPTPKF